MLAKPLSREPKHASNCKIRQLHSMACSLVLSKCFLHFNYLNYFCTFVIYCAIELWQTSPCLSFYTCHQNESDFRNLPTTADLVRNLLTHGVYVTHNLLLSTQGTVWLSQAPFQYHSWPQSTKQLECHLATLLRQVVLEQEFNITQ